MLFLMPILMLQATGINALLSLPAIYQPGDGICIERWVTSSSYSLDQFSQIPDYPNCPQYIQHYDNFEYTTVLRNQNQRVRAFFVSPQSGKHKFFLICNNKCRLSINLLPHEGWKKLLERSTHSSDSWNARITSPEITLMKGFRYMLEFLHWANGNSPDFFRVGVTFPDGTEVKPITKAYLKRSMEFYDWKGLLAQRYESVTMNYHPLTTVNQFYTLNAAKYPANPSSYTCRSTLYDPQQYSDFGENYALRYIGFMRPLTTGTYTFKMYCNEICEFFLTKNNVESSLGQYVMSDYLNPSKLPMSGGTLSKDLYYPIKAFFAEGVDNDYIRILHKVGSGSDQTSWQGMLRNLLANETGRHIPPPNVTVLNSTAISVELPALLSIPPRDNWSSMSNYACLYHKKDNTNPTYTLSFTGSLPVWALVTGLSKYTDYTFYAYYYGKRNSINDHHLISVTKTVKTHEDIPDAPPNNVQAIKQTSTSIKVTWGLLPSIKNWNGIGLGYRIQYAAKQSSPKVYKYIDVAGTGNRQRVVTLLNEYTYYEFQVAGYTSKGTGVYSAVVEERTKEDTPSAGPVNVTLTSATSRSLSIQWQDVVAEHRNGIITKYKLYYKQSYGSSSWTTVIINAPGKSYTITGLNLWTYYDIKVSAFTSVGEGVKSTYIRVRTDEDKPTGPPQSLTTTSPSSQSVSAVWTAVHPTLTNGNISQYHVTCQRTDKRDALRNLFTSDKALTIYGLDEYVDYDIRVAGMTGKGVGPFTDIVVQRTQQSEPSAAPTLVYGQNISSSAIRVQWSDIPLDDRNGIITSYNISYRRHDPVGTWQSASVSSSDYTFVATGLKQYRLYDIKVAGLTIIGIGTFSSNIVVRTDADAPTRAPTNLTGNFIDHRSLNITWFRVPEAHTQGVILGYKLMYKDGTIPDATWINFSLPNVLNEEYGLFNKTVTGLKIYTPYVFRVAGFTYKAVGVYSEDLTVWTDEYIPFVPPKNTTARVEGSTEIRLSWQSMMEIDGDANGKVLGYKIRYQVVDCYEDRPAGCSENEVFEITSLDPNSTISLSKLRKFTEYSISVKVLNRKGEGNYSTPIRVKTDEDKPDAPPTLVETWPGTPESIRVYWSPIPQSLRNGIITGYRVFYKPLDVPMRQYSRSPRSVNQFADYGALPGEKMIQVNATAYQVEIEGLEEFKWYHMRIGAVTSKGVGIAYSFDATCQQRPPITAPDLHVIDQYSFNEITLKWSEISNASARGEVLGYRIMYKPIEQYDLPLPDYPLKMVNVFAPNRTGIIKELVAYTKYAISILAYTEGGIGISSDYSYGETCRCPKVFYSSRMIQPPMVDGHKAVSGILPKYVTEAIESCCGSCSRGHGKSYMNWTRDASGANPVKYTKSSLLDSIVAGTQVSLPLFQSTEEMTGSNNSLYYYVSFLPSPGITIFRRKPTDRELGNKGSEITSSAVYKQYPYLLIMSLFVLIAGMLYWFMERVRNKAEFPERFFCGTGTGMWLAFITMTTVGYGDVTPVSKLGRLFTICWSLMGIILTGFVIGGITESLTTDIVFNGATVSVSSKILVSPEMYSVVKKEFKSELIIGNTSDPSYVVESLLTGRVGRVALDSYRAVQFRDVLEQPGIEFDYFKKVDASYGIALTAEGARIKHCVARYARENAQKILIELSNYSLTFESASSNKIELLEYMTSEHADITSNILKYGGILLALLVVVGLVYDLIKWTRQRAKVDGGTRACELLFKEFNNRVEGLFINLEENIDKIESRHATERVKLLEQDKNFHVTKLYPDLNLFDPTIPYKAPGRRTNAVPCAPSEEDESYPRAARLYPDLSRAHDSMGAEAPRFLDVTKAQNDDNDDDDDYGPLHPIDYKSSWCVCARYFGDLLGTSMLFLMPILMLQATGINALLSLPAIYQPGDGIYIERWVTSSSYGLDKFNQIPDYPNCPQYIQHHDNFEDTTMIRYQYHRVRVFFVSPQSGKHKFFLICNNKCRLSINLLPHEGWKKLIERSTITSDSWNDRITSPEITLMKDFRYMLELLHVGNGRFKDFFKVGVTFPDEFYDWKGLLVQRYESVTINYDPLTTVNQFYTLNAAKYPANPSSYTCRSSLYDPQQYSSFGENYALRYIGFLRPMTTGTYTFKMYCNEICEFFLTKNNVESSLGQYVMSNYGNPSKLSMSGGTLSKDLYYPIKAFFAEGVDSDYIRVLHKVGSGSDQTSWQGMLPKFIGK
eukprot:gene19881-21822_t